MKDISKMNMVELKDHMMSLISEANYNKTLIQEHDTGHIIDYVGRLEERVEEISLCLVSADAVADGYYVKNTEQDPYKDTVFEGRD